MMKFREYFKYRNHTDFPGTVGETHQEVLERLCDTIADFQDYIATQQSKSTE